MVEAKELVVPIRRVRRTGDDLPLPSYATPGAAGMDLYADVTVPVTLQPGERGLVPTGIAVAIPPGFEGQIRPRSGWALRSGLTLLNSPGTIDSDYRGEIQVIIVNLGHEPVCIRRGDRIAQLVVAPVVRARWQEQSELDVSTRGPRGFGHTGGCGSQERGDEGRGSR